MQSVISYFRKFENKKLLILGFGKEGASTYKFLRQHFSSEQLLSIADSNINLLTENPYLAADTNIKLITGKNYKQSLNDFDYIFKSPGIPVFTDGITISEKKLISQTNIFFDLFSDQTIGITGTKGKSTTSSLIFHIINSENKKSVLAGNIGIPAFDVIENLDADTRVVFELSCLQLEHINKAPHIAILLNLFQEHLDYFHQLDAYYQSKFNIALKQSKDDYFIFNADNNEIVKFIHDNKWKQTLIPISMNILDSGCFVENGWVVYKENDLSKKVFCLEEERFLIGQHNVYNIMAATAACVLAGISTDQIAQGIRTFKGLPHRLEYVGKYNDIHFYNDSISTIPEATIEAVNTLKEVNTLILGGKDRGIDYSILIDFISQSAVENLLFLGEAGQRIHQLISDRKIATKELINCSSMEDVVSKAKQMTRKNMICLLSPAAASYGMFKNFEDRGEQYKELVRTLMKE